MRSRIVIYSLLLLIAGGAAYYFLRPTPPKMAAPPPMESVLPKEFLVALKPSQQGGTPIASAKPDSTAPSAAAPAAPQIATFTGNGVDKIHVTVPNTGKRLIQFTLKAGEVYENSKNRMVLLEGCDRPVTAGSTLQMDLSAAALSSGNAGGDDPYTKSPTPVAQLDALLDKAKSHPELSHEAKQTAVLMLVENPVIEVFAKFQRLHPAAILGSGNFKVETADIIGALQLLAEAGITDRLAGADPQLKIEAMIDPKAHDAAARYYGITPDTEWAFWKHELLQGNPSTRHYALYGIARYYPDVALQMLPKWAKEQRLAPIYRLSAVRALAMTGRPDAIKILQDLEAQFAADTDLHKSADRAVKFLSTKFNQS